MKNQSAVRSTIVVSCWRALMLGNGTVLAQATPAVVGISAAVDTRQWVTAVTRRLRAGIAALRGYRGGYGGIARLGGSPWRLWLAGGYGWQRRLLRRLGWGGWGSDSTSHTAALLLPLCGMAVSLLLCG